jgi:hypothetical protein
MAEWIFQGFFSMRSGRVKFRSLGVGEFLISIAPSLEGADKDKAINTHALN